MRKISREVHSRDLARFEIKLPMCKLIEIRKRAIDERVTAPVWAEKRILDFLTNDETTNTQAAKPTGANCSAYSA